MSNKSTLLVDNLIAAEAAYHAAYDDLSWTTEAEETLSKAEETLSRAREALKKEREEDLYELRRIYACGDPNCRSCPRV